MQAQTFLGWRYYRPEGLHESVDVRHRDRDWGLRNRFDNQRLGVDAMHGIEAQLQLLDIGKSVEIDRQRRLSAIQVWLRAPVGERCARKRARVEREAVSDARGECPDVSVVGPLL